jgi:hypothetical protein
MVYLNNPYAGEKIKQNNKASDIKLVYLYSTLKMTHGPINIILLSD